MAAGAPLTLLLLTIILCLSAVNALYIPVDGRRPALAHAAPRSARATLLLAHAPLVPAPFLARDSLVPHAPLLARDAKVVNTTAGLQVVDGEGNTVAQGSASDGGGSGRDVPAIIWMGGTLAVGVPLLLAGIRGWRLTTGAGIGVSAAVLCTSPRPIIRVRFANAFFPFPSPIHLLCVLVTTSLSLGRFH